MNWARYQQLPVAAKLRLTITAACVTVILATALTLMIAETLIVRQRMIASLSGRAGVISLNASAAVMFGSRPDAEQILRAAVQEPGMDAVAIFDLSGHEFARFALDGAEAIAPPRQATTYHVFTRRNLTWWAPMQTADGRPVGTIALRMSMSVVYARLEVFGFVTLGVVVCAVGLALVLSYLLQRVLSRPIDALADVARRITQSHDFSVRAEPMGTDELAELAQAFNVMLAAVEERQRAVGRHARELELRVEERTAELKQAYRELEAFSYSVSHDLRSPLRTITGFSEMILEDKESRFSPDGIQHLQRIIGASARMNRLIDGLLDFSRVSKRELQFEPIDLAAMAREVMSELAAEATGRKVEFSVDPLSPCVGDPTLVRQVLVNLLSNALKYTRERTVATIAVSEKSPNGTAEHTYVVRDNGAGFEMRHATRLFQVFERMHDQRRFEGTGIGLATTKRIIERHGGRIWAEAEPEKGAAFYFTLPSPDKVVH